MNVERKADRLNDVLRIAEEKFISSGMVAHVSVKIPSGGSLVFMKHDGLWGLYVDKSLAPPKSLHSMSLQVRIESTELLQKLWDEARLAHTILCKLIEAATARAEEFVEEPRES